MIIYAEIHEEFNKTNGFCITHTEQEIGSIIWTSMFCADKICYPRPGHVYSYKLANLKLLADVIKQAFGIWYA